MPVAFRASAVPSSNTNTTGGTLTIPASVQANDVMFVTITSRDSTSTSPAGSVTCVDNETGNTAWNLLTNTADKKSWIYWKRATVNSAGKTVTIASAVGSCAFGLSAFSGAITSGNPFTGLVTETNASADETHASFANTDANALICFVVANYANDNAVTSVSGATAGAFTQRHEKLSTGGNDSGTCLWERVTSGNTGAINWAQTDGTTYSHAFKVVENPPFAAAQSTAAFYEDGAPASSTVISSGATSITRSLAGDSNLQLRFRLQETGGGTTGNFSDSYALYASHQSGAYAQVEAFDGGVIDSYAFWNEDFAPSLDNTNSQRYGFGQSFTGNGDTLAAIVVSLAKFGTPASGLTCKIYAHSGTYGSTSVPDTAQLLATADTFDASGVTTVQTPQRFTFSGANQITLQNGTRYVLVIEHPGATISNGYYVGFDADAPTHGGNACTKSNTGVWSDNSAWDMVFRVLNTTATQKVLAHYTANFAEGDAVPTANFRLGAGSGSALAGKASEDGIVNNFQLTAGNYTELVFSVTLKDGQLAHNDTLDFRLYRNGSALTTYTVTPRITVSKGGTAPSTYTEAQTITVTETSALAGQRSESETIAPTESQTLAGSTTQAETIVITETRDLSGQRAQSETIAPVEAQTIAGTPDAQSDTIAVTETQTVTGVVPTQADTVAPSETQTIAGARTEADTIAVTEARTLAGQREQTETIAPVETTLLAGGLAAIGDIVAPSEGQTIGGQAAQTEIIAPTETQSVAGQREQSEIVAITETQTTHAATTQAETVAVAENQALLGAPAAESDIVAVNEAVLMTALNTQAESIAISEDQKIYPSFVYTIFFSNY